MSLTAEKLYELLPAIQRLRDSERGEPLRSLLAVLAEQGKVVEDDLGRLYDNLFIETCDEWVVPYIGDLLGVRGLNDVRRSGFSQRARVSNTLTYRRRKGTATMLEQLALDTTGWRARVVEFFELLSATQWLNHLRPHSLRTPDLRRTDTLELIETAFDSAAHSVDVRHIANGRGRHNIPNIGIFLWRLQSYYLDGVTARPADDVGVDAAKGMFFFHPLGLDAPLFNRPATETDIGHLAEEMINVPGPLRRRPLYDELEARRQALADGETPDVRWFGRNPVFTVSFRLNLGDPLTTVKPEELLICTLEPPTPAVPEVWFRPATKKSYVRRSDQQTVDLDIVAAVDPVHGRIAFPAGIVPAEVVVSAAHGFPGDVGGGAYDRRDSIAEFPLKQVTYQAGVGHDFTDDPAKHLFHSLAAALAEWNGLPAGQTGIIAITDNATYAEGPLTVEVKPGSRLFIVSADWPEIPVPGGGGQKGRLPGRISPTGRRAHVLGSVTVNGGSEGQLWLDGLLVEGTLTVSGAGGHDLSLLRLAHTTLLPSSGGLQVVGKHERLTVQLLRAVTGPIGLHDMVPTLRIKESAVDGGAASAITAKGAAVEVQASTVVGPVAAQQLEAGNSIFTGPVKIERRQVGCVRFCFVPAGSATPRRHRCQPDLALTGAKTAAEEQRVLSRMVPDFTAETYGAPAYLQLAQTCPQELRTGADDGAEMGVWRFLRQPQREANLRSSLDEYLRLGLEAGLLYVT